MALFPSEWRTVEIGDRVYWYRPLYVNCFLFVLGGALVEEAGGGAFIEAAGMLLGLVVFFLFARWLVRRFVRTTAPLDSGPDATLRPVSQSRLEAFADALERERRGTSTAGFSDRR